MSLSALRYQPRAKAHLWRGCESKTRYRDEHDAERARRICEQRRGQRLRVYDCAGCGGFHLSSQPYAPRSRRRKDRT